MERTMLKSKLHRVKVTGAEIQYEGSVTIDKNLMEAADLIQFEQVDIWDVTNGARLTTYVVEGARDSREICINGAAARLIHAGDLVIIASFFRLNDEEARTYKPKLVFVDEKNRISRQYSDIKPNTSVSSVAVQ